jgi:hypothetical protein
LGKRWTDKVPYLRAFDKLRQARSEVRRASQSGFGGADVPPDAADPCEIPSTRWLGRADRTLAEIDQDGFMFAVAEVDVPYFNRRAKKLPRKRYQIDVVMKDGLVCVSKRFDTQPYRKGFRRWFWSRLGLAFYTEAAALLLLRELPCVPQLRAIDLSTRSLYLDYIRGESLRHKVAEDGGQIYDLDGQAAPDSLSSEERERREMELFSRRYGSRLGDDLRRIVARINGCGVLLLDVKLGNVLMGEKTGSLYWIDFERAALRSREQAPEETAEQDEMLKRWFGLELV